MQKVAHVLKVMVRQGLMRPKPRPEQKKKEQYTLSDVLECLEAVQRDKCFVKEYGELPGFNIKRMQSPAESWISWYLRGGKQWWDRYRVYAKGWRAKGAFNHQLAESLRAQESRNSRKSEVRPGEYPVCDHYRECLGSNVCMGNEPYSCERSLKEGLCHEGRVFIQVDTKPISGTIIIGGML